VGARALGFDRSSTVVPVDRALTHAATGTPVVVDRLLGDTGYLDPLVRLYEASVAAVAGAEAAARVRARGLERIHEVCPPDQLAAILVDLDQRVRPCTFPLTRVMVERIAPGIGNRYYVANRVSVRAMVPDRLLESHPELVAAGHFAGHLHAAGRHVDTDLTHPYGCVVVWCAVGPARAGNTVALYGRGAVPLTPELDPGDALVFLADDPHASVVNDTDETRVSISVRVVPGRRLRYGSGHHWRPYSDMRLVDTRLAPFATVRSRCTRAAWRRWRWRRRWEAEQLRSTGTVPVLTKR
jgi:hypothetical protein